MIDSSPRPPLRRFDLPQDQRGARLADREHAVGIFQPTQHPRGGGLVEVDRQRRGAAPVSGAMHSCDDEDAGIRTTTIRSRVRTEISQGRYMLVRIASGRLGETPGTPMMRQDR